jgi:hypothetical protein
MSRLMEGDGDKDRDNPGRSRVDGVGEVQTAIPGVPPRLIIQPLTDRAYILCRSLPRPAQTDASGCFRVPSLQE